MSHIKLGKYNQLEVVKEVDFGVYLNGDEDGEILLPKRYVPKVPTGRHPECIYLPRYGGTSGRYYAAALCTGG